MGDRDAGRDLVDGMTDAFHVEMPDLGGAEFDFAKRAVRLTLMLEDKLGGLLERWGLTRADYGVLSVLRSVGEPYELRPGDLKARLLLTSGGVSNVLNRLAKTGLVIRERDATDGRGSWVRLTDTGVETAEAAVAAWTEAQTDFFRAVPPEVARTTADALRQVLLAVGDHEPPPVRGRRSRIAVDRRPV